MRGCGRVCCEMPTIVAVAVIVVAVVAAAADAHPSHSVDGRRGQCGGKRGGNKLNGFRSYGSKRGLTAGRDR